jgi:hypothetical protein
MSPLDSLIRVTLDFGTTAPDTSNTVPVREELVVCPNPDDPERNNRDRTARTQICTK